MSDEYPNEVALIVPGGELRVPSHPAECDYVRLVDSDGEFAYWTHEEWAEDPAVVMGAIIGGALGGRITEAA